MSWLLWPFPKPCRLQLKCDGTRWGREGKWRGNWRREWVASTLHTTSEHVVSSITTANAHTSDASSRLNRRPSTDFNGLIHFAERRNLVSARVLSHFKWPVRGNRVLYRTRQGNTSTHEATECRSVRCSGMFAHVFDDNDHKRFSEIYELVVTPVH